MVKQGQKAITFRASTVEQLDVVYKNDKKKPLNQSLSAYVENMLLEYVEYKKKIDEYGGFIDYIDAIDDKIFLNDNRIGRSVIVRVREDLKQLHCEVDEDNDCVHVGFCYGVKKVYDILIDRGFRPPKR